MGATIFKQPNGLIGRYSYVCDGFTEYNMTPEEYAISKIDSTFRTAEDTIKHHLGDYKEVLKDAKQSADIEKDELCDLVKSMETNYENDEEAKTYADYYKELFDVISNLAIFYTYERWDVERKKYIITDNLDDMKKMTEKLKEVNSLYNELKGGKED